LSEVFGNGDLPGELGEPAADVADYQVLGGEIDERMRWVDPLGSGRGHQLVIDHLGRVRRRHAHLAGSGAPTMMSPGCWVVSCSRRGQRHTSLRSAAAVP
jgi:hypothetical protein